MNLFNVTANTEEPDKLVVDTVGKQWLVTPNGAALLALKHAEGVWQMDAYALEQCPPQQKLFDELHTGVKLPGALASLPAQVSL